MVTWFSPIIAINDKSEINVLIKCSPFTVYYHYVVIFITLNDNGPHEHHYYSMDFTLSSNILI